MAVWHGRYAVQICSWLLAVLRWVQHLLEVPLCEYPALPSPHGRNDPRHDADMLTGICRYRRVGRQFREEVDKVKANRKDGLKKLLETL